MQNSKETLIGKLLLAMIFLPGLVSAAATEQTASPFPNAKPGINIMSLSETNLPAAMQQPILLATGIPVSFIQ